MRGQFDRAIIDNDRVLYPKCAILARMRGSHLSVPSDVIL